jgi:beta-lactamase class A
LTTVCSSNALTQKDTAANKPADSQAAKTNHKQDDELRKQIEAIAAIAKGRVGVAAEVLETGESVSLNPREHFPMQSVYKFPIGMALLHQVDNGKIKLEERVQVKKTDFVRRGMASPIRDRSPNGVELTVMELLRFMVVDSDGTASDVLLGLVGVEPAQTYLQEMGINEIIIANSEKEIGRDWETQYRNWASPEGGVALLRALHEGRSLSQNSRTLMMKLMTETRTGPRRLKGLLPTGTPVAHRTGTSGTARGITAATNDLGIVTLPDGRHLAIAVFVSDSPADLERREGVIAKIARAVWDKWTKR